MAIFGRLFSGNVNQPQDDATIGVIAGNGTFPLRFASSAKRAGYRVVVVAHKQETEQGIEQQADAVEWIQVGELGRLVNFFRSQRVGQVVMAGGISRVRTLRDVKLDLRGMALMARLRSTKDDIIMRGVAEELEKDGIKVLSSTFFFDDALVKQEVFTRRAPTEQELEDIAVGREAIRAMDTQHIGQLVVVRKGVIVAVEAVEGSDAAIKRGGDLGGPGSVVVKCAKPSQDLRFDVPTVGLKTVETMASVQASVLALEAGRTLFMDRDEALAFADANGICVIGCAPLVE